MIRVSVQLTETSQPIVYENVINTYTKGYLYCIYVEGEDVFRHPLIGPSAIWRVKEEYGFHGREQDD